MYTPKQVAAADASVELANLWNRVFGDELPYVYRFYYHFQNEMDIYVQTTEDDEIVCAAHFLPVNYRFFRRDHKGSYLYAAMTAPEHRGHALMGQLLELRIKKAYEKGDLFMCTLPAEQSLYDLYARFGLEPLFTLHRTTVTREQLAASKLTLSFESKASPYFSYSSTYARRELTVTKPKLFVDYNAIENEAQKGIFQSVYSGYFYARQRDENTVYVKEVYLHGDNFPHIAHVLLNCYPDAKNFIFDFCPGTCPEQFSYTTVSAGSARIINVKQALEVYANKHRSTALKFTLEDPLIEQNTGDYYMKDGIVKMNPPKMELPPMSLSEFTRMILSDSGEGHPYMNMMLD